MANPLGSTPGIIVGVGVGTAASTVLRPVVEPARQQAWKANQNRILDPATMARLVAQGGVPLGDAHEVGSREGLSQEKIDALVYLALTTPSYAEAQELRRRGKISDQQLRHSFAKAQIEEQYWGALSDLVAEILSPGELAAAIHRGLVPDAGLLLGEQPTPPFKVEAYPVQPIDAITEAAGSGLDRERLHVLVGLQGLPMGPHEAAQALFRGIITHGDYIRAFNTSNMRNEWAQAILDQTRQIPTARDFLENALRGYHDLQWAQTEAARHGMSHEDSLVIYQNQGRPMNIHQITQALARGAKFHPEPGEQTDPYKASIIEGPVKPAYYEMAESLKYTLPSIFTMRALAESGVWDEAKTAERLKWAGWLPQDADEAAKAWTTPSTATKQNPWVAKAEQHWWTAAQKAFVKDGVLRSVIEPIMLTFVPNLADRDAIFQWWTDTRAVEAGVVP